MAGKPRSFILYTRLCLNFLHQNFGIVCAFGVFFTGLLLYFTEHNTNMSSESSAMLFKRGTKPAVAQSKSGSDEEKGGAPAAMPPSQSSDSAIAEKALEVAPAMKNVFTWQHLEYNVPVGGGQTRKLLDDVSGFVAPGKLTALMGESGAGKVSHRSY